MQAFALETAGVDPAPALPAVIVEPVPENARMMRVSLRVSGAKPLRLRAATLAQGSSWHLGSHAWHEVQLLKTDQDDYVVAIRCFKKAEGEAAVFRAARLPTLEDAVAHLEAFDPVVDLQPGFDAADRSVAAAEIALGAARLRQQADELTRQWRALVGELLFRLDAED